MKITALTLFILSVFLGCNQADQGHNENESSETISQDSNLSFDYYCFYELDDKYSEESDSTTILDWLKVKSAAILKDSAVKNLFDHKGGGPNGSEWNPSTDLYISITHPKDEKTKLLINSKPYEAIYFKFGPQVSWYCIKRELWESELREIDSADIEQLYSKKYLNDLKTLNMNPITDLDYGDIVKFEIQSDDDTLFHYLHAAFGE